MDNLPVTLNLTVGQINFIITQLMNAPYKEVAQSIAFLQQEQNKAIAAEQARQAQDGQAPTPAPPSPLPATADGAETT